MLLLLRFRLAVVSMANSHALKKRGGNTLSAPVIIIITLVTRINQELIY